MDCKKLIYLFLRYAALILIGIFGIDYIYQIFTPLTAYPVFWILKLFYPVALVGNILSLNSLSIILVPACIAGAAYYLLLILNLSTPMLPKERIKSLLFTFIFFWILNIIRIVMFAFLFVAGFSYFDLAHKVVWYLGSTFLVSAIWFFNVYLFKIKAIPAYTDIMQIYKHKALN